MSKNEVSFNFVFGHGITDIGNISDLKLSYDEIREIKDLLLTIPKGIKEWHKDVICPLLFLGIFAPSIATIVSLSILFFPLGFIGFGLLFFLGLIFFYPQHASRINVIKISHDCALKIDKITISKVRMTFTVAGDHTLNKICLLYTSPSPRDLSTSRMPSSA